MNPHAPQWLKGAISRVDAEELLQGAAPGTFVLRTKLGHGHVLSMVLPPGHPNQYKHHLLTDNGGRFYIDNQDIGPHASVESVIALLQADTLGLIACPLVLVEFDAPEFTAEYGGSMAGDSYNGEAAYDTATGVLEGTTYDQAAAVMGGGGGGGYGDEATYDQAAIGGGGGLDTMGSMGSALYDSAAGVMADGMGGYAEQTANYDAGYTDMAPLDGEDDGAYGDDPTYGQAAGVEAAYQDVEASLAAGDPIYDQAPTGAVDGMYNSVGGGDAAYQDMPGMGDDPAYSDTIDGVMGGGNGNMLDDLGEALYDQAPHDGGMPSSNYMSLDAHGNPN